jgi:hypothetical protein
MNPQQISVLCQRPAPVAFALWRSASLTLPFPPRRHTFGYLRAEASDRADDRLLARKSRSLLRRATRAPRQTLSCGLERVPDRGSGVITCRDLDRADV